MKQANNRKKPEWLKIALPAGKNAASVLGIIRANNLHTICTSGRCPNQGECWGRGTATFMIGGDTCTRACRFCNVKHGRPEPLDPSEPERVARSAREMNLKHVVLTSVDRDDLPDLGAAHWANVIREVKKENPAATMEALVPDFQGRKELLQAVIEEAPDVISHNLETVRRLSREIRGGKATWETSLSVLRQVAASGLVPKTGIMVGLGETRQEVLETITEARAAGCRVITIGQYLQPSARNVAVKEYIPPATFEEYRLAALAAGYRHVESSPLARSSYHAEKHAR
ncbi:MAG: lipoyl synthase [Odoribacteraceae bacterium]|jgi:lipoic acid synthetase|nr:lipoyl synthase [Odoribacteraceae bacterium]